MPSTLSFFVLALLGTLTVCHGLSCTPSTENKCTKSLYVTGKCVSGVCQCVHGTVLDEYGCHKKEKPRIRVDVLSGGDVTPSQRWSGEVAQYAEVHLKCDPTGLGKGQYKWYRNGRIIQNERDYRFDPTSKSSTSKYQCSVNIRGSQSEKSDEVVVNVMQPGDQFTKKPVLVGMPVGVGQDLSVSLKCTNVPAFSGKFVFGVEGEENTTTIFSTLGYIVEADLLNKSVVCSISPYDKSVKIISSEPVKFPANFSDEIPDVFVKGKNHFYSGGNLDFWCTFSEKFEKGSNDTLTYRWTGPQGDMPDQLGKEYYKNGVTPRDGGNYSCTGIYNNRTVKTSPIFTVTVTPVSKTSLHIQPSKPVLGGHISLGCRYNGSLPATSQYSWDYDVLLQAYSDNTLQLNNIQPDDLGRYVTCSSIYQISYAVRYIAAPVPMSKLIQPKIEGVSKLSRDKDTYTFDCTTDYDTPGIEYEWFVDGVKHENGGSFTYTYHQSSSKPANVKCRLSFNSGLSDYSKTCTIPAKGSIMKPVIFVEDSPTSFIKGSSYNLKCSCFDHGGAHNTWKKNGVVIRSSPSLLLQNITSKDNGEYTCTVTLGKDTKESQPFQIVVQDKINTPVITIPLGKPLSMKDTVAKIVKGNSYYLLCSSTAHNNYAEYSWTQNGTPDHRAKDRIYGISKATYSDSGSYQCSVSIAGATKDSNSLEIIVTDHVGGTGHRLRGHFTTAIGVILVSCLKHLTKLSL